MFDIKCLIFVSILLLVSVDESKEQKRPNNGEEEEIQRAPKLKPNQLEFAKSFWNKLGQQQKGGPPPDQKRKGMNPEVRNMAAIRPSGDLQFLDGNAAVLFPMGDRYGGLPDDIVGMGTYCVQFIINGIIVLVYTTIRWPHKILLKSMMALGALTFLPTNGLFCLNPLAIFNFVKKAGIINNKMDQMADLQDEFKKRIANSIDKVGTMIKIQKHSCCAWFDWKRKNIQTVDASARDFVIQWYTAFFRIHEIVYCQTFTMKQAMKWCNEYEFLDMEPVRVLPRSWITICIELFTRFF